MTSANPLLVRMNSVNLLLLCMNSVKSPARTTASTLPYESPERSAP